MTRYEWVNVSGDPARQNITPVSAPDGEWVEYADYAAVVAEREALARQVRAVAAWLCMGRDVDGANDGMVRAFNDARSVHLVADSLPALGQRLLDGGYVDGE